MYVLIQLDYDELSTLSDIDSMKYGDVVKIIKSVGNGIKLDNLTDVEQKEILNIVDRVLID